MSTETATKSDAATQLPALGKIATASGGGAFALLFLYHTAIVIPLIDGQAAQLRETMIEHSARPHAGVSAGLTEVRTNEAKIALLKDGIRDVEDRLDTRLSRIETKIDRIVERGADK